jgi:predicted transcriptional regulator
VPAQAGTGLVVVRVGPDDLVTIAEIARRLGQTRESIRLYSTGERGPGGFPAPFTSIRLASPIYRWGEVARWAREKLGRSEEGLPDPETTRTIVAINAAIELRRYAPGPREAEAVLDAVKG